MAKNKPLIHNKRRNNIRLHSEGKETLLISMAILAAIIFFCVYVLGMAWYAWIIIVIFTGVFMGMVNFFRCPVRMFLGATTQTVVAPADGKVVVIEEVDEKEYFHDKRIMISIFMSPVNVHANWVPCDGKITKVSHTNGKFMKAWLPKASTDNERSMIIIKTPHGKEVMVRQVAGAMARRIVTYVEEGTDCYIDDHLGFIKFGSRVDVYLPLDSEILVKMGQLTTGDETMIAKLAN